MSRKASVSVVIPAYNQEFFLPNTLDSVAAQTFKGELEIIVVDDGSPDDSARVAASHPTSPTVIRQENQGVAAARNAGIQAATGKWIAFLDADDIWLPEKLERQLEAVERLNRPALSFTRYERRRTDGKPVAEPTHPALNLLPTPTKLVKGNFIGCSTVLAHHKVFERIGGFPTDAILQRGGQDYALWLRVAALFPLVYVPEVLTLYTVHADNRVGADPVKHFQGGIWALRSFYEWDSDRFKALAHMDFSAFAGMRSVKFIADLMARPHHRDPEILKRAARATMEAMALHDLSSAG